MCQKTFLKHHLFLVFLFSITFMGLLSCKKSTEESSSKEQEQETRKMDPISFALVSTQSDKVNPILASIKDSNTTAEGTIVSYNIKVCDPDQKCLVFASFDLDMSLTGLRSNSYKISVQRCEYSSAGFSQCGEFSPSQKHELLSKDAFYDQMSSVALDLDATRFELSSKALGLYQARLKTYKACKNQFQKQVDPGVLAEVDEEISHMESITGMEAGILSLNLARVLKEELRINLSKNTQGALHKIRGPKLALTEGKVPVIAAKETYIVSIQQRFPKGANLGFLTGHSVLEIMKEGSTSAASHISWTSQGNAEFWQTEEANKELKPKNSAQISVKMDADDIKIFNSWTEKGFYLGPDLSKKQLKALADIQFTPAKLAGFGVQVLDKGLGPDKEKFVERMTQLVYVEKTPIKGVDKAYFEAMYDAMKNPRPYNVLNHNCADTAFLAAKFLEGKGFIQPGILPKKAPAVMTPSKFLKMGQRLERKINAAALDNHPKVTANAIEDIKVKPKLRIGKFVILSLADTSPASNLSTCLDAFDDTELQNTLLTMDKNLVDSSMYTKLVNIITKP